MKMIKRSIKRLKLIAIEVVATSIVTCLFGYILLHSTGCGGGKSIRVDEVKNKTTETYIVNEVVLKFIAANRFTEAREAFCWQTMVAKNSDAIKQCGSIGNILNSKEIKNDCIENKTVIDKDKKIIITMSFKKDCVRIYEKIK